MWEHAKFSNQCKDNVLHANILSSKQLNIHPKRNYYNCYQNPCKIDSKMTLFYSVFIAKAHSAKLMSLAQTSTHSCHNISVCALNCDSFYIAFIQNAFSD